MRYNNNISDSNKQKPTWTHSDLIGLEVEFAGKRGWVQEVSSDEKALTVALYPNGKEIQTEISKLSELFLYGPPLDVPEGFVAVDFLKEESGERFASIRMESSFYREFSRTARVLGQDFESFLRDSLIAGIRKELSGESA